LTGPWNYIVLADPDNSQYIAVLPSVAKTSLLVNASAGCSMLGSTCPQPDDLTWHSYDAWTKADGKDSESYLMPPSDWDEEYTALLNLTGAGGFFADQIVLQSDGNYDHPATLEYQGMAISKDWTVNLGAKQYTRSFGLVSLLRAPLTNSYTIADSSSSLSMARATTSHTGITRTKQ
jgi:hypothetical protein